MNNAFALVAVTLALVLPAAAAPTVLHVAPGGDDAAAGTAEAPLAGIEGARDALRKLRGDGKLAGGAVVVLAAGRYERTKALTLGKGDGGTAEAPIVYRAADGAEVRISGGRVVTGFEPVTDPAELKRLPPGSKGKVLRADLKAPGIAEYGRMSRRGFAEPGRLAHMELFYRDRPMTLSRWPNEGFARIASLPKGKRARVFAYEGDRPKRWRDEPDAWVYGYWYHDWADTYMKVEAIDPAGKTLTVRAPAHRYGLRKGNRWHALNLLCELDSPGEFYVDREAGVLYFRPPGELREGDCVVSIAPSLVEAEDASHVTFRGLTFEACRGTAVKVEGGRGVRVVGCTIRNTGKKGVVLVGRDHAAVGCDIHDTGGGGIVLRGGDRKTLTPGNVTAENNHVHRYSRWCHTYRAAVSVGGCGNVVRHNLLHDGHHNAIQLGGNDHVIEFNEVHSVCWNTGDVGAFYMGRDWTARGTVIRHNFFHHISGPGHHGAMGVYLDDQASGIRIVGNVFHKVTRAVFLGGGCDNVVANNLFVACVPAVHLDNRGMGWQKKATDDPKGTLRTRFKAMPVTSELWRKRYPKLAGILDDDPGVPKRNRFVRNVCIGGQWEHIHRGTRHLQTIENNLTDADASLVDPPGGDFRVADAAAVQAIGFEPIPFEKIGLLRDRTRASWPVHHQPRKTPAPKVRRPVPATPKPVAAVPRIAEPPTIDGRLGEGEHTGKPLTLAEGFDGSKTPRTSRVWIGRDDTCIYVAFDNTVLAKPPLKRKPRWGHNDACEIALRNPAAGAKAPILVLRGYADDASTFTSGSEAGAPKALAAAVAKATTYAAGVVSPTRWTCEWRIPLPAAGIDPKRHERLEANFSVRKTADDLWLQWHSTRGNTYAVERAGVLKLAR